MASSTTSRKRPRKSSRTKPAVRTLTRTQVPAAIQRMFELTGTARFAAGKALVVTAEKSPDRVYPYFDTIVTLLAGESKIVRWNAMQILARLAPADTLDKTEKVLDTCLAFIRGDNMVSAANAITATARMALAKPHLLDRVVPAILEVERATYETPECRNVAIGHALDALAQLWPDVRQRPLVAAFVRRQQANTRAAVARKANRMAVDLQS